MNKTGIILLAAGASSRLGQPKQQLQYQGQTLLQHALQTASQSSATPILVVLGANADNIQNTIDLKIASIIQNPDWPEGMASSIRVGLENIVETTPDLEAVIFMVCDQPFVSAALLNQLILTQNQTGNGMVACAYQETLGTPVLFTKKYFPDLLRLQGQEGAKKLLKKYPQDVASVSFPEGAIDIDTRQDYEALDQ